MEDPPHYKKFKIDVRRCIICERKAPDTDYIENPSIQAINKLITNNMKTVWLWWIIMGAPEQSTTRLIGQRTVKNGISYHKNCYKNVTQSKG